MRLSFNNSLGKKAVLLSSVGMLASIFILIIGLLALSAMEKMVGLQDGIHEHTIMHFQSLDHMKQYIYNNDPQDYQRFMEIRTKCKRIAHLFSMADGSYSEEEIMRTVASMGKMLSNMTIEEGKAQVALGRKLRAHPLMAAMIQAAKESAKQEARILEVMAKYHDNPDAEYRKSLKPEMDQAIAGLIASKENFSRAASDLNRWTGATVRKVFIGAFFLFLISSLSISYLIGKSIVKPIVKAIRFAERVSKGSLEQRLAIESNDEIRDLANAINAICDALQNVIKRVISGAETLTESAQDLTATANQFATTATQTSASVSEINVTAQELKQAVQSSAENADSVAAYAQNSVAVYDSGKKAAQQMGEGMSRINLDVADVGERIVNLSSQAIRIAEIIDMVDEVAHQSELLSVNASIEAAKAGEFGRGFQVVAAEVKTLSEQSKGATKQVRDILKEIQKAADAAAKAAEKSALAVKEGLKLNDQVSDSMARLADSFEGAAAFTRKIAASSRQELQGVSQVTDALADIKDATQQNTAGARLMEDRSAELVSLAKTLMSMVEDITV